MFIVEMVNEVFKQLRLKSPRVYLDTSLAGHDYNTRRKQKGLIPSAYNRLVLKQRSLTIVLRKTYSWINLLHLIPPEQRNLTAVTRTTTQILQKSAEFFVGFAILTTILQGCTRISNFANLLPCRTFLTRF